MVGGFRLKEIMKMSLLLLWLTSDQSQFHCSASLSSSSFFIELMSAGTYDIRQNKLLTAKFHAKNKHHHLGQLCFLSSQDLKGRLFGRMKFKETRTLVYNTEQSISQDEMQVGKMKKLSQNKFVKKEPTTSHSNNGCLQTKFQYQGNTDGEEQTIQNLLICGDGDLSYSASIAPKLADMNIQLTATVLESEEEHQKVYKNSQFNTKSIQSFKLNNKHKQTLMKESTSNMNDVSIGFKQNVFFGIDATDLTNNLKTAFEQGEHNQGKITFDRIQFNFPHWRGKANHKYNRVLLNDFLESASKVLSENGEIYVALCEGQGGATALNLEEWRQSWIASTLAAEHGLILANVVPFKPLYDLSSHRGVDRPFKVGKIPKLYIFTKEDISNRIVDEQFQLCCSHELHVLLPDQNVREALSCQKVEKIIQNILPDGIIVKVPVQNILDKDNIGADTDMVVYLIVYCGETKAMTRQDADIYRAQTENELLNYASLRENRRGRLVSRPFPYPVLESMVHNLY